MDTGMFIQIFKRIAEGAKYLNADWALGLVADAVFVPYRKMGWSEQNEPRTPDGTYSVNGSMSTAVTSAIWRSSVAKPSPH